MCAVKPAKEIHPEELKWLYGHANLVEQNAAYLHWSSRGVELADEPPLAAVVPFTLDPIDGKQHIIYGFFAGYRWSGGYVPYFLKEGVQAVIDLLSDEEHFAFDWDGEDLVFTDKAYPCESELISPSVVKTEVGDRTVYSLGLGWTWMPASEDELRDAILYCAELKGAGDGRQD